MRKREIIKAIKDVHSELYAKADYYIKRADMEMKEKCPAINMEKSLAYAIAFDYADRLVKTILRRIERI